MADSPFPPAVLEAMLGLLEDPAFLVEASGQVSLWNPAASQLLGDGLAPLYSLETLLFTRFPDPTSLLSWLQSPRVVELRAPEGSRMVWAQARLLGDTGYWLLRLAFRPNAFEVANGSEAATAFSGFSHQLKNHLNTVRLLVEASELELQRAFGGDHGLQVWQTYRVRLNREVDRMSRLIDALRCLRGSRPASARLEPVRALRHLAAELSPTLQRAGASLELHLPALELSVPASPEAFLLAMRCLILRFVELAPHPPALSLVGATDGNQLRVCLEIHPEAPTADGVRRLQDALDPSRLDDFLYVMIGWLVVRCGGELFFARLPDGVQQTVLLPLSPKGD